GPVAAVVALALMIAVALAISRFGGFHTAVLGVSNATSGKPFTATPTASGQSTGAGPASAQGHARGSASSPPAESANTRGPSAPTRLYLRASTGPVADQGPAHTRSGTGGTPPAGQLQVSPGDLPLGTGTTGEITLTASGGPVSWSATTASMDVTLSGTGGTIPAGSQTVITVTVSRSQDQAGQATIAFGPGSQAVTVSWSSPASSPPPPTPPTATPTPTVITSSPAPPSTPTPTARPTHTPIVVSPTVSG
ncbi:MAG: hypothetical protein ACRDNF_17280, partial [Streptosporangiaceae bacterium]